MRPDSPEYWHNRAEEQRTIADTMATPHCRATMLALARESENMARRCERHADDELRAIPRDVATNQLERVLHDLYNQGLYWIIRERGANGGWPPRDIGKVSGWTIVRMLAGMVGKSPRAVAVDLIERNEALD